MRYAIVENEYHSLSHIKGIMEDLRPEWQLVFTSGSVKDTIEKLRESGLPDLIFLDIDLDDGNSFKIFDEVKEPLPVIFTTAYDEFCLKAFKVHSIDYLMKPITTDALLYAIRKFEMLNGRQKVDAAVISDIRSNINDQPRNQNDQQQRILIPSKDGYRFIKLSEISWITSDMKCVVVIDKDGNEHITTFSSLNEMEDLLPRHSYFRISRSVITSISAISDVRKSFNYKLKVVLRAGVKEETVELGMTKKKEFLNWFGCNKS